MDIEENIINNFSSEEEEEEEERDEILRDPLSINKEEFENEKIIQILQFKNILKKEILCTK